MRLPRTPAAIALAMLLSACANAGVGGISTPAGPGIIPSTAIELGNWRETSASQTLAAFRQGVEHRYGAGVAINAVSGDLRRNNFNCAPPPAGERGAPPAQVCRRTITSNGCTHTWQVHLFDTRGDRRLAQTRALYDRRCGGEGLLGGPR